MGEGTPWEQPVVSFLRPTKNKGDQTQASHRLGKPFPIERHPWSLVYLAWILLCRLSVMSLQWNVHGRLVGAGVMENLQSHLGNLRPLGAPLSLFFADLPHNLISAPPFSAYTKTSKGFGVGAGQA